MSRICEHEAKLGRYLYDQLALIEGLTLYGPNVSPTVSVVYPGCIPLIIPESFFGLEQTQSAGGKRTGLVAFNSDKVHATDLSFFLDKEGIAIRTGYHCTQPLHAKLGATGSCRYWAKTI